MFPTLETFGFDVHSRDDVRIRIISYDGLQEFELFDGTIKKDTKHTVDTSYKGMALLVLHGRQSYPLIVDGKVLALKIQSAGAMPSFEGGGQNNYMYKHLQGERVSGEYPFAALMIEAKNLLGSSGFQMDPLQLRKKKREFFEFVHKNYDRLRFSDMVRRLIAQSFMMHEYVNYHVEGEPAVKSETKYQQAVLGCVRGWLDTLKPYIPKHEMLNYVVSLYYERSMVTMASFIIDNFKKAAFCPGVKEAAVDFSANPLVTDFSRGKRVEMSQVEGVNLVAFVSESCPVSLAATVTRARQYGATGKGSVIVASLEKLSSEHRAMNRLISGRKILFISDEQWRRKNLPAKIRLPYFIIIEKMRD